MWLLLCPILAFLLPTAQAAKDQPSQTYPYAFRIAADEVSITFHAFGADGRPLTSLTRKDLRISDDGKPQNRIVMLQSYQDLPIRTGFLFDTSASMLEDLSVNRSIISLYASRLLRKGVDRAFVMQFDTDTLIRQSWSDNDLRIAAGVGAIAERHDRLPITALFDSLYTTCRDLWSQDQGEVTGNFILLFSDGLDDASHARLSDVIDMCQRTRTAIYVISNDNHSRFSQGQRTLEELAHESGGRIFFNPKGNQV